MKNCPFCAEEIQEQAIKCKHCGEMLTQALPSEAATTPSERSAGSPLLQTLGTLLVIGGIVAAIYYWRFYDTSVETPTFSFLGQTLGGDRVHNIGLMQERQNGLLVSIGAAVAGFICVILGQNRRGTK